MSLTAQVKSELVRVPVGNSETRRAEVSALLRFAGTLQVLSNRLVIEAEVDSGEIADRLAGGQVIVGRRHPLEVTTGAQPRQQVDGQQPALNPYGDVGEVVVHADRPFVWGRYT